MNGDQAQGRRVVILGPPHFWPLAFRQVRTRGDRVVRLLAPRAGRQGAEQLNGVLADLRSGQVDEVLVDLIAS